MNVPEVEVRCRECGMPFKLPADHEDVAHPFPGPICWWCEYEASEAEQESGSAEDDLGEPEEFE